MGYSVFAFNALQRYSVFLVPTRQRGNAVGTRQRPCRIRKNSLRIMNETTIEYS